MPLFVIQFQLPRAVNTQALSGAGILRMVNKAADAVNKMTIKMNESDAVRADFSTWIMRWINEVQQLHFKTIGVENGILIYLLAWILNCISWPPVYTELISCLRKAIVVCSIAYIVKVCFFILPVVWGKATTIWESRSATSETSW